MSDHGISLDAESERKRIWVDLLRQASLAIGGGEKWHWFRYHFSFLPPHPLARSVIDACADCEKHVPRLGSQFIQDIASIAGKEKHEPHYDQLLQKLCEILVLRQLLSLEWEPGTTFQHEPAVSASGKRPELRVITPNRKFLFEVKAPSLLAHLRVRNSNPMQTPGRVFDRKHIEGLAAGASVTLPRDNPIKDFLIDADKKFAQFKEQQDETSILIIVWDDFIYEPITVLTHKHCGLLTSNSYLLDDVGNPLSFKYIDAVVLVRHMTYLFRATGDYPLEERSHALDFGNDQSLPNVIIPLADLEHIPDIIRSGLRAQPLGSACLQHVADYKPKDIILWV